MISESSARSLRQTISTLKKKMIKLFETLKTKENVDISLISVIKIAKNFPDSQFKIDRFNNPYQVDRNEKGGRIMLLFREELPVEVLSVDKGNESCSFEVISEKSDKIFNMLQES